MKIDTNDFSCDSKSKAVDVLIELSNGRSGTVSMTIDKSDFGTLVRFWWEIEGKVAPASFPLGVFGETFISGKVFADKVASTWDRAMQELAIESGGSAATRKEGND